MAVESKAVSVGATGVTVVGSAGAYFEILYLAKEWAAAPAEELTV